MGKFKNALSFAGEVASKYADQQHEVNELANKLVNKTYGVDYDQAKKIAQVLITQAEVTWK